MKTGAAGKVEAEFGAFSGVTLRAPKLKQPLEVAGEIAAAKPVLTPQLRSDLHRRRGNYTTPPTPQEGPGREASPRAQDPGSQRRGPTLTSKSLLRWAGSKRAGYLRTQDSASLPPPGQGPNSARPQEARGHQGRAPRGKTRGGRCADVR